MDAPRTLGPYRLERLLGQGGMGAVWAARHVRTGRAYAVKVLLPEQSRDRTALLRFRREAEALAAVGHAHIVPIHDYDEGPGGEWFLAMDLLEGEDLASRLARSGPLPWTAAIALLDPILGAIEAAHAAGLVHRDLKPSNIFLARQAGTGEEKPMLLDFGLARSHGAAAEVARAKVTATGTVLGTPAYMSPEQAQGAAIDGRSDLWSLAVILYEMIAGRPPFDGPTLTALLLAVVTATPPRLSALGREVPEALEGALERAMAKAPEQRFSDVRSFREALSRAAGRSLGAAPLAPGLPPTLDRLAASLAPTVQATPSHAAVATPPPPSSAAAGPGRYAVLLAMLVFLPTLLAGAFAIDLLLRMPTDPDAPGLNPPAAPPVALSTTASPPDAPPAVAVTSPAAPAPSAPDLPDAPEPAAAASEPSPPARSGRAVALASRRAPGVAPPVPAPPVPAPPVPAPPSPPAAAAPPAGPPPEMVAAAERMGEGDFDGCLRALAPAGTSAPVLGMRMNCAYQAARRHEVEATCALLHRHHPRHAYTSTCDHLLDALPP